jgi:photosystem II stability/assembly factor-like uncharacterized protein
MRFLKIFSLLFCIPAVMKAQIIQPLTQSPKISLRGLSVVNDGIIWASGNKGQVARSTNGGKSFEWMTVKGFEQRDFRDIAAFDSDTAIIMAVAEPAILLKTRDGGKSWYTIFEDSTKGMFLDAMDFKNENIGVVIGDPINHHLFKASTMDKGEQWHTASNTIELKEGEAFFAASGTNIKFILSSKNFDKTIMVTGGAFSSLYMNGILKQLPIIQGKQTTGANSIDIYKNKGVIVGGDFANDKDTTQNCVLVDFNKEIEFSHPQTPPHGYRSCVIYIDENTLIACGTSGVDLSMDGGRNWQLISTESYHVVKKATKGNKIVLAGSNGRIAELIFPQ